MFDLKRMFTKWQASGKTREEYDALILEEVNRAIDCAEYNSETAKAATDAQAKPQ